MPITVDEVQARIAAFADQDADTSNIPAAEYSLRLKYINMAQSEWENSYDWQELYKEFNTSTSLSSGNASVTLPTDFKKLASFPVITHTGTTTDLFPENRPQEAGKFGITDKRVEIRGNYQDNYTMVVYGVSLQSGASIKVPYYASAQSLVSPIHVSMIPNGDYLVKRTIAYLWEAVGDARFPGMKQEAETILRNMLEYENVFGEASTFDRVRTVEENRYSFRLGKD